MPKGFNKGELVQWCELYADGYDIRDVGAGVIIKKISYNFNIGNTAYENYEVYRTKHGDTMIFEVRDLKKINDGG
tara:strand:+ start:1746 stop:1970 length:225 start_codon:yes stop_codon:yes gene_type:complete